MISDNMLRLKDHIARICQKLNRRPQEITVVGITKYSGIEDIQKALACGLTHIGESRVQQALKHYPLLSNVTKHMVGHLQTNKVKDAVLLFDMIQSVDSLRLAQEIDRQCALLNCRKDILVQVNTSGEEQKYGIAPDRAMDLLQAISALERVDVKGLMTIGPLTDDKKRIAGCFQQLRELFARAESRFAQVSNIEMKFLSMGMSDDYPVALEEGANMLRIGRDIFLDRP